MKPVASFLPTPQQVMACGDAWDKMSREGRSALLNFGGKQGVMNPCDSWSDIPALFRLELAHRLFLARDFLVRALP